MHFILNKVIHLSKKYAHAAWQTMEAQGSDLGVDP